MCGQIRNEKTRFLSLNPVADLEGPCALTVRQFDEA